MDGTRGWVPLKEKERLEIRDYSRSGLILVFSVPEGPVTSGRSGRKTGPKRRTGGRDTSWVGEVRHKDTKSVYKFSCY